MIWKLFKPNIKRLKEKEDINRLIRTLRYNDSELRRRATFALIQLLGERDVELRKKVILAMDETITRVGEKNLIDIVRRIKSQIIDGESNRCFYCGKIVNYTNGRRCSFCKLMVCDEHSLPETHGCTGENKPPVGIAYTQDGKAHAQEGRRY